MVCKNSAEDSFQSACWPLVTSFPCLGHTLQPDSGVRECVNSTKRGMWRAFWGNCGSTSARTIPLGLKMKLLSKACVPILDCRCSRWPPQRQIAIELDRLQTKMIATLQRVPRISGEAADAYCRRRKKAASKLSQECGIWSKRWYARAIAWDDHVGRAHNPYSWPSVLQEFQGADWLDEQRVLRRMQGTGTRASAGRPCMRWSDGIAFARATAH